MSIRYYFSGGRTALGDDEYTIYDLESMENKGRANKIGEAVIQRELQSYSNSVGEVTDTERAIITGFLRERLGVRG
jgi:hypothetical protein